MHRDERLEAHCAALTARLTRAAQDLASQSVSLQRAAADRAEAREQLAAALTEADALREAGETITTELEQAWERLRESRAASDVIVERAGAEVAQAAVDRRAAEVVAAERLAHVREAQRVAREAREEAARDRERAAQAEARARQLEAELARARKEVAGLVDYRTRARGELAALKAELGTQRDRASSAQKFANVVTGEKTRWRRKAYGKAPVFDTTASVHATPRTKSPPRPCPGHASRKAWSVGYVSERKAPPLGLVVATSNLSADSAGSGSASAAPSARRRMKRKKPQRSVRPASAR